MFQDIILMYLMALVKAPTWCWVFVAIDLAIRMVALGMKIQKKS